MTLILLDLRNNMATIKNFGAAQTSSPNWNLFLEASKSFELFSELNTPVDEYRLQYKEFFKGLVISKEKKSEELSSLDILGRFVEVVV